MSELSNNASNLLSDPQSLSRAIVGSVGALSGAAIAVGVPFVILHYGNAQQDQGNFERLVATAVFIAAPLGSIVSLLSVLLTIRKR